MKYFSTISFCPLLSLLDVKGNIPNALHVRRMTETGDRTPKYPNDFPKMFIKIFMIVCAVLTLTSCGDKENSELQTVFVDNDREDVLPLSEIADEIKAVEPELTDESLLNIDHVLKVLLADEYIVVCEWDKIFVFDKKGKFVRQIGSKGQGTGEFAEISDITFDAKSKQLFVSTRSSIMSYDLFGRFIKKSPQSFFGSIKYISYSNSNGLMLLSEKGETDEKGEFRHSILYKIDKDMQITDSISIRKMYMKTVIVTYFVNHYISNYDQNTCVYCFDAHNGGVYPAKYGELPKPVTRDTLYGLEKDRLVPYLKLKIKDAGMGSDGYRIIDIYDIVKSSRFVFATYNSHHNRTFFYFCYDTKTGKGYNMKDGYTDDIHNTPEKVHIRLFDSDANRFYYLYTNMDNAVGKEEPNPTLYIGTLKK